jgi:hypothetical protein
MGYARALEQVECCKSDVSGDIKDLLMNRVFNYKLLL